MFDQDEAAMSEGEGAEETQREQKKRSLRGGRKAMVRVRVTVRVKDSALALVSG